MSRFGVAWVVADSPRAGRELVTLGRRLAERVVAFVPATVAAAGPGAPGAALAAVGADLVYSVDPGDGLTGPALAGAAMAVAAAAEVAAGGRSPDVVLFPMTFVGREAGARLSAAWDRPVITNAHEVVVDGGAPVVGTVAAGGAVEVRTEFSGPPPWLVGVRPRSVEVEDGENDGPPPEVIRVGPPSGSGPRVLARHVEAHDGVALDDAEVVVAGGRGVLDAEGFALVAELADLLGGAVGATRAAVEAGWAPHVAKVGLTGKSVAPLVYLAFGISGASQHLVGMVASRHVIAVNTDRHAPIFGVAELGVVGDATSVLRRLVEDLRPRRETPGR